MLGKKAVIGTTLAIVLLILGATRTATFDKRALAAVTLVSFTATGGDGQVLLEWETATEIENVGFFVHRSTAEVGEYVRISPFIPSEAGGIIGAEYSYLDQDVQNGTTYYYKLESVATDGSSELYGPISATPGVQPTATAPATTTATATPPPPPTATPTPFPWPTATPTPTPTLTPHIGYGMAVASVDDQTLELVEQAGFEWVLYYASWALAEPFQRWYDWAWLNDAVAQCEKHGLKIVMRVDRPPAWANGGGGTTAPPTDPTYLRNFMTALVSHFGHRVWAYVIWNEPNLAAEWGGQAPDAAQYVSLLQAAYEGAKAVDPAVTIVSAGLAPTNDISPVAVDDRIYLQEMYNAGVADYFDILGANPMGFASSPDDTSDPNHFYFSRVTELRDIMVANGDGDKQVWALEFGWLHDTDVDLGDFNWMKVSPQEQADYLVRAYRKALEEWPWMGVMFVWNLDFSAHYPDTSHQYWFSIINEDYTPRPAYLALKEMTRWAHVNPPSLDVTLGWGETVTRTLTISNTGWADLTFEIGEQLGSFMLTMPLNLPRAAEALGDRFTPSESEQPSPAPVLPPGAPILRVLADGASPSAQIQVGRYYTTTEDNEDNYHTGNPDGDMDMLVCGGYWNDPIEFNIFVDGVVGLIGNALTIRAWDVDYPTEVDKVRLNGIYLGDLAGYGDIWSETVFDIPAGVIVPGPNLVEIDITSSDWCVTVDWGQLFVSSAPVPWLDETPKSGSIPSSSSQDITVTFDATGVQPNEHLASILVSSNDPSTPLFNIPVTMTVNPTADMGRVTGAVSDAWTELPLTATVELIGVYSMTASPNYTIWAPAGTHILTAYASGYVTTYRLVAITAGGLVTENLALEPAQPRLEWAPAAISATAVEGGEVTRTLMISNTGPLPLDIALYEINPPAALQTLSPSDLAGKRILYDRAHSEPASSDYSSLVNDAIGAGATVTENWYFPIDAAVLEGYDVLWVNCRGGITWGFSELNAVNTWLNKGGAVLVQGESSPATSGPASIFGIYYVSDSCTSGTTTNIVEHPVSEGVSAVNVEWTCWRLAPGSGAEIVVFDPQGQPHVVAQEQSGGKMVVVASEDFSDWHIENDDNRLLANNILAWLARPAYSDVPWLSETPETGTIPGHSSLPVTLEFDATSLSLSDYQVTLAIEHNDPAQPSPIEVPVTLTVALPKWELFLPLILKNSD